ncbi:hypothetical protein ACFQU3_07355 [Terrabacter sp. GCM10028922]|uniref:hypothetical protein n=1 Tax=Terrabacter sp. GCM10028922 TaxID=3273428 RepID=UPI0036171146
MATRKTRRTSSKPAGASRRTTRRTASSAGRRRPTGALYPRRRRSRPGLPTTVGTALGTLVVTTLLDVSWPVRIGLIALVVVVGLGYVLWRHRAEVTSAGGAPDSTDPAAVPPDEHSPPAG